MNLAQIQFEARQLLNLTGRQALTPAMDEAGQTPGGALTVLWNVQTGGTLNPSTGARAGAVESQLSGTLVAVAVEAGVHSVVRTYTEIGVGDLIVTLGPSPVVELCPGQTISGTLSLDQVAAYNPFFQWQGQTYVQKNVTDDLRTIWTRAVAGVPISKGILLRRST
jgi:hypothetical protein